MTKKDFSVRRLRDQDINPALLKSLSNLQLQADRPMTVEELLVSLSQKDNTYFLAEYHGPQGSKVVGMVAWKTEKDNIQLYDIIVDGSVRRRGIATQLISFCKRALLRNPKMVEVYMIVPEEELGIQCFLRSQKFTATKQLFSPDGEEAYLFEYPRVLGCDPDISTALSEYLYDCKSMNDPAKF